jgi:hypothetical protein
MKVSAINSTELAKNIVKDNPKMKMYQDVVEMAIRNYVSLNFDKTFRPSMIDEIDKAIHDEIRNEIDSIFDQLVASKQISIIQKNGEVFHHLRTVQLQRKKKK